jgi:hypothetical protein
VAHEHVLGEVGRRAAEVDGALHAGADLHHLRTELGEVEVGAADAAGGHLDEHLTLSGRRVRDVVADEHRPVAQHCRSHR